MGKVRKDLRKNIKVSEENHKGLKHLAYQRRETIGATLKRLIEKALLEEVFGKKENKV